MISQTAGRCLDVLKAIEVRHPGDLKSLIPYISRKILHSEEVSERTSRIAESFDKWSGENPASVLTYVIMILDGVEDSEVDRARENDPALTCIYESLWYIYARREFVPSMFQIPQVSGD